MDTVKAILNQFKDPELLIIIGCIIVALVLLRILSEFLSRHKVVKVVIIGAIILSLVVGVFWFVEHRKEYYSENSTSYVYGQVQDISSALRKIKVKVGNTNVVLIGENTLATKNVIVDVDMNCKFLDNSGKEISFDDIAFYDSIKIYVKE